MIALFGPGSSLVAPRTICRGDSFPSSPELFKLLLTVNPAMATLTSLTMEQRDDVASEAISVAKTTGDYFFLFESQVENRFAKPRREPRRQRIFRRFSRRARSNKDWRRTRMLPYDQQPSPDTTALMSEDEHSLIHSYVSGSNQNNEDDCGSFTMSEVHPNIIWPETMSLVGDQSSRSAASPIGNNRKRKPLMKKWKSRMRKSLKDALAKSRSYESDGEDEEDCAIKADDEADDDDKSSVVSVLVERAKRSLRVSFKGKNVQRAKALLHEEDIGLYVRSCDDEVETVYKSTFEQLCVPSFKEERDSPPSFPETVSLDDGYAVAHLMNHGKTSLSVSYGSDFAQLELQSDDEYDPEDDDASFTDDNPALPELPASGSEETEYNLFNQSSIEEDTGHLRDEERFPSLLERTSTVSEDPSLLDGGALDLAWPLPQCRNAQPEVVMSTSSDEAPLFVQESTSTEAYSISSRRLGAARASYPRASPLEERKGKSEVVNSSSTDEEEDGHRLGISCPVYSTKTAIEDAADVWKRIYAPPVEAPPSPTVVQKSRATWGCGLDASPISVHSDITETTDVATSRPIQQNPFYNIRRYVQSCVLEEDDHPFDEVDSNACAPPPVNRSNAQERVSSFGCGVVELARGINKSHIGGEEELLGHNVVTNEEKVVRPRCECVKCSVSTLYASLLTKK